MRLQAFAFTIVFVWTGPYIYFTLASLDFTFNRLNEARESKEPSIRLSHGRASERYGSISSMTSRTNLLRHSSFKSMMQSSLSRHRRNKPMPLPASAMKQMILTYLN